MALSLFLLTACQSTPKPKAETTGAIAGKFELYITKTYLGLKQGPRNDKVKIRIEKIDEEGKPEKSFITTTMNGFYYFYNLPAGEYRFHTFFFEEEHHGDMVPVSGKFENSDLPNIFVQPGVFHVITNLKAKTIPHKATGFLKAKFNFIFTKENIDEIKDNLAIMDKKGYWENYKWERATALAVEDTDILSNEDIIDNLVKIYENDMESSDKLYDAGEYYLSLLKMYRAADSLTRAYYIRVTDKVDYQKEQSIYETAKAFKDKLTGEQKLLLVDLADFYTKSETDIDDPAYQEIFTMSYVRDYLDKIGEYIVWLKKELKIKTI